MVAQRAVTVGDDDISFWVVFHDQLRIMLINGVLIAAGFSVQAFIASFFKMIANKLCVGSSPTTSMVVNLLTVLLITVIAVPLVTNWKAIGEDSLSASRVSLSRPE